MTDKPKVGMDFSLFEKLIDELGKEEVLRRINSYDDYGTSSNVEDYFGSPSVKAKARKWRENFSKK